MIKFECRYFNKKSRSGLIFSSPINYFLNEIDKLSNTRLLDVGCGDGKMSIYFALKGASVTGVDINVNKLSEAKDSAHIYQVENKCTFIPTSTENMYMIADGYINTVFSMSTIQYMQKDKAIREYIRVLSKNGSLMLIENLPFNPFINIYRLFRRMTANNEHKKNYIQSIRGYLTFAEIDDLKNYFETVNHKEFHLLNAIVIMLFSNKIPLYKLLERPVVAIDNFLFLFFPSLKKLCWITAVVCRRKK